MRRLLRVAFREGDEPGTVVITPAVDYIFPHGCGFTHGGMSTGLKVTRHPEGVYASGYPATVTTISAPWQMFDYEDYVAMVGP